MNPVFLSMGQSYSKGRKRGKRGLGSASMATMYDKFLEKWALAHADIRHHIVKGDRVVWAGNGGIVVEARGCVFAAAEEGCEGEVLAHLPEEADLVCSHSDALYGLLLTRGFEKDQDPCVTWSWDGPAPEPTSHDIRRLGTEWHEVVSSNYHLESPEGLMEALREGRVYGLFEEGGLAAFAGFHPEGSMGMLLVFPEHRRKGCGEALENFLIRTALADGGVPHCHVFRPNEASHALQAKLGMRRSSGLCWWTWKKDVAG